MRQYINTPIGRLRAIGFLEGISLLVLLFIAMPVKYLLQEPMLVRSVGMAHGLLFILFVIFTLGIAMTEKWSFRTTTWKVLIASVIPFGTFYVDRKILSGIADRQPAG